MIKINDLKGKEIPFLITYSDRDCDDFEAHYKTTISEMREMTFLLFQEDGYFFMTIREDDYCQGSGKFYASNEVNVVRKFENIDDVVLFIKNYLGR